MSNLIDDIGIVHWVVGIFGWLIWTIYEFSKAKNKSDKKGEAFNIRKYWSLHWDDILFSMVLIPVIIYFLGDIVELLAQYEYLEEPEIHNIYYGLAGPLARFIYYIGTKINP